MQDDPKKMLKRKSILWLPLLMVLASSQQIWAQSPVDSTRLLSDLKFLSSAEMGGRKTGSEGSQKAMEFIEAELQKAGTKPWNGKWRHNFAIDAKGYPNSGTNVVAYLKGSSDSLIVVSAHYDHLGAEGGKIHYGADDNASGVAVLLEAARYFSKANELPYTLVFAAFDAEEKGLLGAYAFVEDLAKAGAAVKLNLNMDMVSKGYKNELFVAGTYHYPGLKKWIDTTGAVYSKVQLKTGHDLPGSGHDDWTFASDHGPFHKQKIPFLYFGVEDHPHYHQPTDTFDKTPHSFFLHSAETIIGFVNHYLYNERQ